MCLSPRFNQCVFYEEELTRESRVDGCADVRGALDALAERGRFGIRLGLGRTRALLRALGDPQRAVRGALIGGTNGKGSVLALAGARSARRVPGGDDAQAAPRQLSRTAADRRAADRSRDVRAARRRGSVRRRAGGAPARPADRVRAADRGVFRWFAEERVEVALVEVGLGGRLDATHAWDGGVAAITNVALDHMAWLGDTIPAIAREKAAIIKRGDVAVTGATGEALEVIRRRARRVGAPLTVARRAAARLGS